LRYLVEGQAVDPHDYSILMGRTGKGMIYPERIL
jgi:hypothetical protein